jgi:hypothetical protein
MKILQIFSNCVPIKNPEEKSAEISRQAATKNLSEKFSDFQEKFVEIKFSEFVRKIFRTQIFLDRTKPW